MNVNMKPIRYSLYSFLACLSLLLLTQCTTEEPFFPADPNKLSLVATQVAGNNLDEGKTGIKVDADFTVIFSRPVHAEQAASATSLTANGQAIALTISFNDNQSIMALTPQDSLPFETPHVLQINSGSLGVEGETLGESYTLNFVTEIEPKPLFAAGAGTEQDPYVINTPEQFDLIRLFLESYFVLSADIDLAGLSAADPLGWQPLGTLDEPFIGNIDGAGFTVSGVNINRPDETEVGLFGTLGAPGLIQNLNVSVTGVAGGQATGALVGRQLAGTIMGCSSSGSITTISSRAGGLVGSQESGLITQCWSSCGVFGELSRIGGLVGLSQAGTVSESYTTGNSESLSSRVGGVVGSVEADATVNDCYATGNITARNRGGGAFGRLDGRANNCYATGNVTITDADESGDYPGHVVGQVGSSSSYSNLYYPNDQTINYSGGADITTDGVPVAIGTLTCGDPNAILAGFDVQTIWKCPGDGQWLLLAWQ